MTCTPQYQAQARTNAGTFSSIPVNNRKVAEIDAHSMCRDLLDRKITVHSIFVVRVQDIAPIAHIAGLTHIF